MLRNYIRRFDSAGQARSFIRTIACQFSDPEFTLEFITAVEIVEAALVFRLIEENSSGTSCFREPDAAAEEYRLAVERLKVILAKLN